MTNNPGFENKQIELSSADAKFPQLAIQAAQKLDELIEARKATADAARRLAEVLKSFRLQPVAGAVGSVADSGTAAVFSPAMDESAPGGKVSALAHLQTLRAAILNRLVPMGYQDEAGFHYGVERKRSGDGSGGPVQSGGPLVEIKRGTVGGQGG